MPEFMKSKPVHLFIIIVPGIEIPATIINLDF